MEKTEKKAPLTPAKRLKALLQAVKAKCLDCAAGVQAEVDRCRVKDCPLYGYRRPHQTA